MKKEKSTQKWLFNPEKITSLGRAIINLFFIITLLSPLACATAFQLAWRGRIFPGVKIANISVGKLTPEEAEKKISREVEKAHLIALSYQDRQWIINLDQAQLRFSPALSAKKAFLFGRRKNLLRSLKEQYQAFRQGVVLPLDFSWDKEKLTTLLTPVFVQINQPAIPFSLQEKEGKIIVQPGKQGKKVDQEKLFDILAARLEKNQLSGPLPVPVINTGFVPTQKEIANAQERGEKLKGKTIIVTSQRGNFVIDFSQLLTFVDFQKNWNREKILQWTKTIRKQVEQPPQNARFRFENGRVKEFSPSQKGFVLDEEQLASLIIRNLEILENNPSQKRALVSMPLKEILPKITTANSNQLGITDSVGKGESWFYHSSAARIHNIKLGSSHLDGLLIAPGEEFSFNKAVGEVSRVTGYKPAWIIKNGRTVLGDGGGLCQVSTTLFRAALAAGLPILERHAHAYRVSYYEYNSPLGTDATVFAPSVDLRFKNDYPCHLLIQRKLDMEKKYLAFEIYGCPDGRVVTMKNFKTWDVVPPPPPLYIDDPTLPAGTLKRVESPIWGAKASFEWQVSRNGQILYQQTFFSHYRAWQAVYLRGTKPN